MSGEGGRKGRRLSQDEHSLWQGVTRAIAPLRKRTPPAAEIDDGTPEARTVPRKAQPVAAPPAPKSKSPAPTPLDRRLKQKIARGNQSIDARLDLHGMTQGEAHAALVRFLRASQTKGATVVLVITGKGSARGANEGGRGVLKRMVPMWLRLPELSPYVVGFSDSAISHGGEGALYVRLRKRRD